MREKAITLILILLALFVLGGYWWWGHNLTGRLWPIDKWDQAEGYFSYVSSILNLGTLVIVLVAAVVGISQLRATYQQVVATYDQLKEMEQTRHFTVLSALLSKLTSKKSVSARKLLYQKYSEDPEQFKKPFSQLPEDIQNACDRVRYDFSELGLFVHTHLKGQSIGKELFHVVPAKMWIILEPYVRTTEGTQGIGFKYMAKLGIDYWFETRLSGTRSLVIKSYVEPSTPRETSASELKDIRECLERDLKQQGWL